MNPAAKNRPSISLDEAIGLGARLGLFDARLNRPPKPKPTLPPPATAQIIGAIKPEDRPAHWYKII